MTSLLRKPINLIIVLSTLAFMPAFAVDSEAQIKFVSKFGEKCSVSQNEGDICDGKFYAPSEITLDSNGKIYVGESTALNFLSNHRIQVFNAAAEKFLFKFGEPNNDDPGYIRFPQDLETDAENNILVANGAINTGNSKDVQVFNSNGAFQSNIGDKCTADPCPNNKFKNPAGIAVDKTNNRYVLDKDDSKVKIFKPSGASISSFGGKCNVGSCIGQFDSPSGIAVGKNNLVYVADYGNSRVQVLTSSGTLVLMIGNKCDGAKDCHKLSNPTDVEVDANGRIYVLDGSSIVVYDKDGKFLDWAESGCESTPTGIKCSSEFFSSGIAVGSNGNIYVADGSHQVQHLQWDGVADLGLKNVEPKPVDDYDNWEDGYDEWGDYYDEDDYFKKKQDNSTTPPASSLPPVTTAINLKMPPALAVVLTSPANRGKKKLSLKRARLAKVLRKGIKGYIKNLPAGATVKTSLVRKRGTKCYSVKQAKRRVSCGKLSKRGFKTKGSNKSKKFIYRPVSGKSALKRLTRKKGKGLKRGTYLLTIKVQKKLFKYSLRVK